MDKPEDRPEPAQHFHDSLSEIVHTALGACAPLVLGLVPVRWKDTGALSWMVSRANPEFHDENGRASMEPMALMMDEELLKRLDFGGGDMRRVGDDARSQKEVAAEFGLPVQPDDAALQGLEHKVSTIEDVARIIEDALKDQSPGVKVIPLGKLPASTQDANTEPAAAWPWPATATDTKQ